MYKSLIRGGCLHEVVTNIGLTVSCFKNLVTMEAGCLRHAGASTVNSQLLDEDCSHGWQILKTQPWAAKQQEEQALGKGMGGELPWRWSSCHHKKRQRKPSVCTPRYDPGAHGIPTHAHVSTPVTTTTQLLFIANSVKLHLTAYKSIKNPHMQFCLLFSVFLHLFFQYNICKKKLNSKREALKILTSDLELCQRERDIYKTKIKQLVS